jgi:hypothetical protein
MTASATIQPNGTIVPISAITAMRSGCDVSRTRGAVKFTGRDQKGGTPTLPPAPSVPTD